MFPETTDFSRCVVHQKAIADVIKVVTKLEREKLERKG